MSDYKNELVRYWAEQMQYWGEQYENAQRYPAFYKIDFVKEKFEQASDMYALWAHQTVF